MSAEHIEKRKKSYTSHKTKEKIKWMQSMTLFLIKWSHGIQFTLTLLVTVTPSTPYHTTEMLRSFNKFHVIYMEFHFVIWFCYANQCEYETPHKMYSHWISFTSTRFVFVSIILKALKIHIDFEWSALHEIPLQLT